MKKENGLAPGKELKLAEVEKQKKGFSALKHNPKVVKKSRIRETPNLSTDANSNTNTLKFPLIDTFRNLVNKKFCRKKKKKKMLSVTCQLSLVTSQVSHVTCPQTLPF